jgi:hypothetical protein
MSLESAFAFKVLEAMRCDELEVLAQLTSLTSSTE